MEKNFEQRMEALLREMEGIGDVLFWDVLRQCQFYFVGRVVALADKSQTMCNPIHMGIHC